MPRYAIQSFYVIDSKFGLQVVLDESGFSKGYGFVRFGNEQEQQHALGCMTGEMGLGSKPIKVIIIMFRR